MPAALLALACAAPFDTGWSRSLPENAEVTVPPGKYVGPWRLGSVTLHAAGATVTAGDAGVAVDVIGQARVDGLHVEAAAKGYGVRVERSASAILAGVTIRGPAEALVYVAEGSLTLDGGVLEAGDYGVLTEQATAVTVSNAEVRGQARAGVAVVNGPADVEGNRFTGPFGEAAVALLHADGRLARNVVAKAGAIGIKVVNGRATLADNRVAGARTDAKGLEGDGVYVYGGAVSLRGDEVDDCQAAAISAIGSEVVLADVTLSRSGEAALYVSGGKVDARRSRVKASPAGLLLERNAKVGDGGFAFEAVEQPVVQLP